MANNLIQIKRSTTTAQPASLNFGELAYTTNGDVLYIGNSSVVVPIGGKRVPGTLTANQAMVVNATSGIDKVIVANLTPTQVYANGSVGTGGWVLASGAAGNVYWVNPSTFSTTPAGANTQIEFNDSGIFGADANLTFNKSTVTFTVNGAVNVGTGTSNVVANTTLFTIQTAAASANLSATALTIGSAVQNASAFAVGSNLTVNASALNIAGNTTTAPTTTLTGASLNIGNTSITGAPQVVVANSSGNTIVNTTSIAVQNTSFSMVATPASIAISNSTYNFLVANTSRLLVGNSVALIANGGVGSAAQVLTSNGTGVYWGDNSNGTVTSVATANGVGGGTITTSGTLYVVANNGIVSNTSGVFAKQANGISVDASGINVVANNGVVSNTSGVFAKAANGISVDASGINVVGSNGVVSNTSGVFLQTGSTLTTNTSGLHVNTTLNITDLTLSGNLTINGTLTTVDTTNLQVKDGLIKLADQNLTTDSVDAGFYSAFGNSTVTQYSGLFRDATDGIYKLFTGLQTEPTTTVNIAGTGYALANLQLNSLTLTSPLLFTSGGVGVNTAAKGDIFIAGSANPSSLTQLGLGTDGYVLTANSTTGLPQWQTLDGGTF